MADNDYTFPYFLKLNLLFFITFFLSLPTTTTTTYKISRDVLEKLNQA